MVGCREVDDGNGEVSADEFCAVAAKLGVALGPTEALALFKRFGSSGSLAYSKWVHVLVNQASRQVAEEMPSE
jgi:hypothetical protein